MRGGLSPPAKPPWPHVHGVPARKIFCAATRRKLKGEAGLLVRLCVWSQAGRRDVHSKFSLHVLINGNFTLLAAFFSEYKTEYPLFAPQLPL